MTSPFCPTCMPKHLVLEQLRSANLVKRLRDNCAPVDSERSQFTQFIDTAPNEMQGVDDQIARHQAAILSLQNRRSELVQCVNHCNSLLAPVRRLPAEMLARVFSLYCTHNEIHKNVSVPGFVLGSVCSHWRAVALSTRNLWSSLHISFPYISDVDHCHPVVDVLLERSGSSPLILTLDAMFCHLPYKSATLNSLIRHSERWRDLKLYVASDFLRLESAFSAVQNKLPRLESIFIDWYNFGVSEPVIDVFENTPCLREVHMPHLSSNVFALPWKQLTTVSGTHVDVPSFLDGVRRSSSIRHLSFTSDVSDVSGQIEPVAMTPTVLPHLSSFQVELEQHQDMKPLAGIFQGITAPNLTMVKVLGHINNEPWPQAHFINFLRPSFNSITSLHLTGVTMGFSDLMSILGPLSSLTTLAFDDIQSDTGITNALMARLITFDVAFPLLKHLKELDLRSLESRVPFESQTFSRMVHSRWVPDQGGMPVDCLRKVSLHLIEQTFDASEEVPMLRHLQKAGMRISLRDYTGCILID